jgi:hypothetical protein
VVNNREVSKNFTWNAISQLNRVQTPDFGPRWFCYWISAVVPRPWCHTISSSEKEQQ